MKPQIDSTTIYSCCIANESGVPTEVHIAFGSCIDPSTSLSRVINETAAASETEVTPIYKDTTSKTVLTQMPIIRALSTVV